MKARVPMPEFYGSTVVSDKGQIVIPVEARNALSIEKGEKLLVMSMDERGLMLMKVSAFEEVSRKIAESMQTIKAEVERKETDYEHCD